MTVFLPPVVIPDLPFVLDTTPVLLDPLFYIEVTKK